MAKKNPSKNWTPTKVRLVAVPKLLMCLAFIGLSVALPGPYSLLSIPASVWYSWIFLSEFFTGTLFEEASERARGVTILVGVSLLSILVILAGIWLSAEFDKPVVPPNPAVPLKPV